MLFDVAFVTFRCFMGVTKEFSTKARVNQDDRITDLAIKKVKEVVAIKDKLRKNA